VPLEVAIIEIKPPPLYQEIAPKAKQLRELGMTQAEIGRRLGVDRWAVGKALRWLQGLDQ
jgi:transcriptional regulator with XRE-family HTH domain